MCKKDTDIIITQPEQILHFTGCYAEGYLLLSERNTLITDARYYYAVKKQLEKTETLVVLGDFENLCELLAEKEQVAIDYESVATSFYKKLSKFICVKDASNEIKRLIARKSPEQLEAIRKSCSICERAYLQVLPLIKEGVSELEIAAELEYLFKKFGASGTSFETIVAFGENSAVPHHQTSNDKLKRGSVVLMDFGCRYMGMCSDMTRTIFFGQPSRDFLDAYEAVKIAHLTAKDKITLGMSAKDADLVARNKLKEFGLDERFTHSLGHGIGTLIHEYPSLSKRCDAVLENGNVFSIEPGVYFDGKFGIRIEDTCALIGGRVESFMTSGIELKIL